MVAIQNTDAITAIRDGARLSISEGFPTQLSNLVTPTLDMTPDFHRKINIIKTGVAANATSATIYTTVTGKQFLLYGFILSVSKDVTATSTSTAISFTSNSVACTLAIGTLTLTVEHSDIAVMLPIPIAIDSGTAINVTNTTATGNITSSATILGSEINP